MLSFPILLVLLVIVFGSLAAASLPLAVGGIAILGAFTVLNVATQFGDVSVFAINIVTMLGLGLAIDYALFVVSRFREELAAGFAVEDAVVRTMATAGRTVAISGLTVAVSLGALLLFPMNFLQSMGLGGIAAVVVAMVAALTTLPALLGGHRPPGRRAPAALASRPRGGVRPRLRRLGAVGAWRDAASGHGDGAHRDGARRAGCTVLPGGVRRRRCTRAARRRREPRGVRGAAAGVPERVPPSPIDVLLTGVDARELPQATQTRWARSTASPRRTVTAVAGDAAVVSLAYAGAPRPTTPSRS